jgi:hypothetical protein
MRTSDKQRYMAAGGSWLALVLLWTCLLVPAASAEDNFPLLQIGTRMYTNVTVTTRAKTYVFVVHAGGMNNIKIADLPEDVREKLGYGEGAKSKPSTNSAAAWAKAEVEKLAPAQVKEMRQRLVSTWTPRRVPGLAQPMPFPWRFLLLVGGLLLSLYLVQSYSFMLICRKTGQAPGFLVWVPLFQLVPLLRAAGMSGWWLLGFLLPFLNLVASVLWSIRIVKARGKGIWVTILLIIPVTYPFAILYLAFSGGGADGEDHSEPDVVFLQAA